MMSSDSGEESDVNKGDINGNKIGTIDLKETGNIALNQGNTNDVNKEGINDSQDNENNNNRNEANGTITNTAYDSRNNSSGDSDANELAPLDVKVRNQRSKSMDAADDDVFINISSKIVSTAKKDQGSQNYGSVGRRSSMRVDSGNRACTSLTDSGDDQLNENIGNKNKHNDIANKNVKFERAGVNVEKDNQNCSTMRRKTKKKSSGPAKSIQ